MFRRAIKLAAWGIVIGGLLSLAVYRPAYAATIISYPDGDVTTQWNVGGGNDGSCSGSHCTRIDEVTPDTSDYISTGILLGGSMIDEFNMQNVDVGQGATQVVVKTHARSGLSLPPLDNTDDITVQLWINGSYITSGTSTISPTFPNWANFTSTFTGTWSQANIDGMRVRVTNNIRGILQNDLQIASLNAEVTYTPTPQLTQAAYRAYQNANSSAPGSPLAATNTAAELLADGAAFRLRVGLDIAAAQLPVNFQDYKLQTALRSGTCDTAFSGESYSDINTSSGAIRWYDNAGVANNTAITSNANDPTTSGTKIYQTYRESNPFNNSALTAIGQTALWDFALQDFSAAPGDVYCFRVVKNDGNLLSYTAIPEVRVVGDLSVDIVDSGGVSVASPTAAFSAMQIQHVCSASSGTLGVSAQRLRITNDIVTNGWAVSIAPTAGPTATWSDGSNSYDFNDPGGSPPGCADSADADSRPGRLTINSSAASIAPESGCTTTGVSLGSSASFSEGSVNSIGLVSASSVSDRFCYWDITGIALSQQIPSQQPAGSYGLQMTVTVVAQ